MVWGAGRSGGEPISLEVIVYFNEKNGNATKILVYDTNYDKGHYIMANTMPEQYSNVQMRSTSTSFLYTDYNINGKASEGNEGFVVGDHYCHIGYSFMNMPETDAREKIVKIEDRVRELWRGKQPTLRLTHIHPFSKEALANSATGGDIIATLYDSNSRPMAGQDVYFFLTDSQNNNNAIDFPETDTEVGSILYSNFGDIEVMDRDRWNRFVKVTTYANGQAIFNYLKNGYVNLENLEKPIKVNGCIWYTILAYVYTEDPRTTAQKGQHVEWLAMAQTDITFIGVAVIKKIEFDLVVQVKRANSENVIDLKRGDAPYTLMPGDEIRLNSDISVPIYWLSGEKFSIVPKTEYLAEGHEYASFTIGYKDMGVYHRYLTPGRTTHDIKTNVEVLHVSHEGMLIISGEGLLGPALWLLVSGVLYGAESYYESQEQVKIYPIEDVLIDHHSLILVDFYRNAMVYTVEGLATVYGANGSFVNVTTGEKINVTQNGTFGEKSVFNQTQLSDDQKNLVEYAQESFAPSNGSRTSNVLGDSFIVVIGAVILLGIVVLITVVVYRRKRR